MNQKSSFYADYRALRAGRPVFFESPTHYAAHFALNAREGRTSIRIQRMIHDMTRQQAASIFRTLRSQRTPFRRYRGHRYALGFYVVPAVIAVGIRLDRQAVICTRRGMV